MTTVGKLLVFMNLVFSLVVGAFAVMDYTARTHWSEAYKKLESQYAVSAGTAAAYKSESERLLKQQVDLNEKLAASGDKELRVERPEDAGRVAAKAAVLLDERARSIDALKKQLEDKNRETADLKVALAKASTTTTVSVADVARRQEDTSKLVSQLNDERNKNNMLVIEKNRLRDEKTAADIDKNAFKARAEQLASDN
ncbi:MAG: hypothetical protein EBV06_09785, partial [Planctomycetia bacterium]|nr:hypothetical protein [Planctomycetia bacterium]